jgi:hypothetical protein
MTQQLWNTHIYSKVLGLILIKETKRLVFSIEIVLLDEILPISWTKLYLNIL